MELFNKKTGMAALLSLSALMTSVNSQAASTEFSANIAFEGACEVSTPATVIFNNGDAILPSEIEAASDVTKKTFNLTLSNCQGLGVTPKISVSGQSNADSGKDLFLDAAASTATGYGILLQSEANEVFEANANLATVKTISVNEDWDTDTSLTTINGTIPMAATLTCGDCDKEGRLGGELKSNVTFEFQYD